LLLGWHEPQRAQHHEQASYGQQSRSSYGQGYDDNSGYNARLQTGPNVYVFLHAVSYKSYVKMSFERKRAWTLKT